MAQHTQHTQLPVTDATPQVPLEAATREQLLRQMYERIAADHALAEAEAMAHQRWQVDKRR